MLSFTQLILGGQGVCPPSTPLVPSLDRHMNQNNSEENEPTQEVSIASKPDREAKKNGSQSPQVCFYGWQIKNITGTNVLANI